MQLKHILLIVPLLMGLNTSAQWLETGNAGSVFPPTNNFLGSDGTNPYHIQIGVTGSQDIFIDNDPAQLYPPQPSGGNGTGGHWIGLGRVFQPSTGSFANTLYSPQAHLHIAGGNTTNWAPFTSGLRNWFNTGTLYTEESDGMYVGLRKLGFNSTYAVINWSDDANGGYGTDFLTFNFTGAYGLSSNYDGAELARMSPRSTSGTFGIGNFQYISATADPVRRLELLDYDPLTGNNSNTPQLRTTYQYDSNPFNGIFTEFQTTNSGDMYFNSRNSGNQRAFGFHTNAPGNIVEIASQPGWPYYSSGYGSSGLRFSNLRAYNTPMTNPGTGVLGLDNNGDIIYVDATPVANNGCSTFFGNVVWGGNVGGGLGGLLSHREIMMNGFQSYFTGNVGEGITIGSNGYVANAKLQVHSNDLGGSSPMAIYGEAVKPNFNNIAINGLAVGAGGAVSYGVVGESRASRNVIGVQGSASTTVAPVTGLSSSAIGVKGFADNTDGSYHTGVAGLGGNSANINIGAELYGLSSNTSANNYGVYAVADGGITSWGVSAKTGTCTLLNYGVYSVIDGFNNLSINPGSQNRAVYGKTQLTSNHMGIDNYAGWFDGDVFVNGTMYCPGGYLPSDRKLKHDIDTITNALGIIKKLQPRTYLYDTANVYKLNLMSKKQYGFISQDVYKILPELTTDINKAPEYDSTGKVLAPGTTFKGLNYNGFFAIMMKGIQEQQTKIDSLVIIITKQDSIREADKKQQDSLRRADKDAMQKQLDALAAQIRECCARQTGGINGNRQNQYDGPDTDVNLNNKDIIVLEQNVPNPFAEQTVINYNIPNTVTKAQIIFYNSTGNIIQTVDIKTRGRGKVNVFASDLSSGLYNYTLVADGKVIDSKKMVRE